jgi:hypothetical protein
MTTYNKRYGGMMMMAELFPQLIHSSKIEVITSTKTSEAIK